MKAKTFSSLPKFTTFGGALFQRNNNIFLSFLCLIIVTIWNTHSVTTAPAKLDSLDSTFPLDFQPPVFEASSTPSDGSTTIDSYGNPIGSLKPIQTPDGRKVVSAQGLQFEIPNYASGITELKKPADDLLPPFVGEFSNDFDKTPPLSARRDDVRQSYDDLSGIRKDSEQSREGQEHVQSFLANEEYESELQPHDIRRVKRQLQHTTDTNNNNNNSNNNNNAYNNYNKEEFLKTSNLNTITTNKANTTFVNNKRQDRELITNPISSSSLANNLDFLERTSPKNFNLESKINSPHSSSFSYSPRKNSNSYQTPSTQEKLSAHFIPLSNGNFNYPNLPTDASVIDRLVSKYKNPLPTLDPIVVALPNTSPESLSTIPGPTASAEQTTSVDVESVPLVELKQQETGSHEALILSSKSLPDYILDLNDPDIGGPVEYKPAEDNRALNVIAWDLLPPVENDLNEETLHNSIKTGHNLNAEASQESSQKTLTPKFGFETSKETTSGEGSYYTTTTTTTTPRTTFTTTPKTTTTTTARTTTTPRTTRTTTTRRTTTPRTTTTTTTPEPDSSEFFKLEQGDSYTLPPWLQDIDDPDLDVAVTFEIPEDINEYNHTIERDLLAPLEPYTDLNNLHLTPPTNFKEDISTTARTTTTTTTTTRRPTQTTYAHHWVRAKSSTPKPTIATFNKQFTSLNPSILSSTSFAQSTTSTTTTVKPQTSVAFYNRQLSSNTAQTDKIGSSSSGSSENENRLKSTNPFLRQFDDGKYKPQQNVRRTATTTTTTTTTTPAPITHDKNPFEATIPPWLKDFDYPDLGPGVPFIYDPNEDENPVDKNILPPTKSDDEPNPTNPKSNSPFLNSQTPQGFTNKISTSALSLTSSSSIPSITTIPFPSAQQTNQDDSTLTRPPHVFVPPKSADSDDDITKKTSTTFNKNFAAPFDSSAGSTSSNSDDQKKVPLSADRESFPPFNSIITGSSTVPSKTTFSKSEDGKVITNNIFLSGGVTSTKPLGSNQEKNTFTTQSSSSSSLTTSAAASAFVTTATFGSGSSNEGTKYTGRFGGPPGVLAPQVNDFSASNSSVTKSINQPAVTKFGITSAPAGSTNNKDRFSGSFGGPPGVLKPYDNIKNR